MSSVFIVVALRRGLRVFLAVVPPFILALTSPSTSSSSLLLLVRLCGPLLRSGGGGRRVRWLRLRLGRRLAQSLQLGNLALDVTRHLVELCQPVFHLLRLVAVG